MLMKYYLMQNLGEDDNFESLRVPPAGLKYSPGPQQG